MYVHDHKPPQKTPLRADTPAREIARSADIASPVPAQEESRHGTEVFSNDFSHVRVHDNCRRTIPGRPIPLHMASRPGSGDRIAGDSKSIVANSSASPGGPPSPAPLDPLILQPKLMVGAAGDAHEQEADRLSELAIGMSEPARSAPCGCNAGCSCAPPKQAGSLFPRVQARRVGLGATSMEAPPLVHQVIASPGQPLDSESRSYFEPRFDHDFSKVRIHADAAAGVSASQIQANAYTVGNDIVFGAGRFAPHTLQGQRLLAHELTHVVQQSGVQSTAVQPVLQRDIGFEFQLRENTITTNKGKKFPRKAGKFFHRVPESDKNGLELQAEAGSFMEFETHFFRKWSDLQAQIQSAVDVVTEIKKDPKAFPFNQEKRLRSEKVLDKDEKLEVDVKDSAFVADLQSTEAIALTQYASLLREHERNPTKYVDPVLKDAQDILNAATADGKSVKASAKLDNLLGFLQIIMNYVRRGQGETWDTSDPGVVKATFRLMMRVDFASVFRSALSADERKLFREIVKSDAIPKAVGLAGKDAFFKSGYWGDLGEGKRGLLVGGKVTAVAQDGNVHDCSLKTKTPGVDSSMCGTKMPGTAITVGSWLNSIVSEGKDQLSPPPHGSISMGQFKVHDKGPEKGLAIFEVRGTEPPHNRQQPASGWVSYADEIFRFAAVCRPRPGTGTDLIYDGPNKLDPKNCP